MLRSNLSRSCTLTSPSLSGARNTVSALSAASTLRSQLLLSNTPYKVSVGCLVRFHHQQHWLVGIIMYLWQEQETATDSYTEEINEGASISKSLEGPLFWSARSSCGPITDAVRSANLSKNPERSHTNARTPCGSPRIHLEIFG
jgi:hypothetical protein